MPRPRRIQAAGLTYHITGRGVRRSDIFLDDVDRGRFLKLLAGVVQVYDLRCHAYCEMTNHYHLAITTTSPNLSEAMYRLNGRFAQWWNWRHEQSGHLFHERYGAQIVQDESYLANVCRYIVLNPVRAGMVALPEQWPWSSYRAMTGLIPAPRFLDCTRLAELMAPDDPADGPNRFREWVLGTDASEFRLPRRRILGDEAFVSRVSGRPANLAVRSDHEERTLESIFDGATTRSSRDAAIAIALQEQYTLSDIARHLQVHVSTVSRIASQMQMQGARPL
jgi:REP element-mobilizing transposase RayT